MGINIGRLGTNHMPDKTHLDIILTQTPASLDSVLTQT